MAVGVKLENRPGLPGRGRDTQAVWLGILQSDLKAEVLDLMGAMRYKWQELLKTAWGKTSANPVFISAGEEE